MTNIIWLSCIRGVSEDGTLIKYIAFFFILPPVAPVKPTVIIPLFFAASKAFTMFAELPEVLNPINHITLVANTINDS